MEQEGEKEEDLKMLLGRLSPPFPLDDRSEEQKTLPR